MIYSCVDGHPRWTDADGADCTTDVRQEDGRAHRRHRGWLAALGIAVFLAPTVLGAHVVPDEVVSAEAVPGTGHGVLRPAAANTLAATPCHSDLSGCWVWVTTWGNGEVGDEQENGADGVRYFTNVLYVSDGLESGVRIQFSEAFEAEYGDDVHHAYYVSGVTGVRGYDNENEARRELRARIAEARDDDQLVRNFRFEFYPDDDGLQAFDAPADETGREL